MKSGPTPKLLGFYLKTIEGMLFRLETAAYLRPELRQVGAHMTTARGEIIKARQVLKSPPRPPGARGNGGPAPTTGPRLSR